MQDSKIIHLVKNLSNIYGAPGFEGRVADFIEGYTQGFGPVTRDKMSNLYLSREGNHFALDDCVGKRRESGRLTVQLDAHMDEVAFMVSAIRENGCLEFITLGGWVSSNIPAHLVEVRKRNGEYITGLTTSKPPHFMSEEERKSALKLEDIVIDIGCNSAVEVAELGIDIGAPVVPKTACSYDEERGLFLGKAFDCRAGCAAMIGTLETLENKALQVDVTAAFSTQEEVGTRGAQVTANRVKPDLAIVFEGCPADDTFMPEYKIQTAINRGPMLRHIDNRMITHPGFQRYALDLAEERGIPVQSAVRSGGSTNGAPIHLSNLAVPTIVVGIPVRYIHTAYSIMSLADLKNAIALASAIIEEMDIGIFASL